MREVEQAREKEGIAQMPGNNQAQNKEHKQCVDFEVMSTKWDKTTCYLSPNRQTMMYICFDTASELIFKKG